MTKGRPLNIPILKEVAKYAKAFDKDRVPLFGLRKIGEMLPANTKGNKHDVKTMSRFYNQAIKLGLIDKETVEIRKKWSKKFAAE